MNNRRKLVIALGVGAFTAPFHSFAQQQGKVWRVGFLAAPSRPASIETSYYGAFPQGMRELSYVEGKNLTIEWRFPDNQPDRLAGLVAELVQLKVDAIAVHGSPGAFAVQKATTTIPIVFVGPGDPVAIKLVKSLARQQEADAG